MVTSGGTTTTWTVTRNIEGTTQATHTTSTPISIVITAGALDALRGQWNQYGTYASKPNSGMKTGDFYRCTDAPYSFFYNGSAWLPFIDPFPTSLTIPTQSMFSNDNVGSVITETVTNGSILMSATTGDGTTSTIRGRNVTLTSNSAFTCTIVYQPIITANNYNACGLYLDDGTKKYFFCTRYEASTGGAGLSGLDYSAYNTYNGANRWDCAWNYAANQYMWLKLQHASGTRYFSTSPDGGVNWYMLSSSQTTTTYLTPTKIGYCVRPQSTTFPCSMNVVSFSLTYP